MTDKEPDPKSEYDIYLMENLIIAEYEDSPCNMRMVVQAADGEFEFDTSQN